MRVQLKRVGNRVAIRLSIAVMIGLGVDIGFAQAQRLPPPPSVPALPPASSSPLPTLPITPGVPDVLQSPNDRVYTAPGDGSIQLIDGRYRVFVDSDSPFLLQQVRSIQPDAFIQNFGGRRVIQAGLFNDQFKARQQVSRLAAQGIDAQIATGSFQPGSGNSARGYYAIVPGNPSEVRDSRDRAIRLGVSQSLMQVRDRPRGLHLAVGPFSDQRDAERVVRYLRDRGSLDARLFYDR